MPLVSIVEEVKRKQTTGGAVPLFVVGDVGTTRAIVEACEEKERPAILGFYVGFFDRPAGEKFAEWVRAVAVDSRVPLSLMLDHGHEIQECKRAIELGFTDVMYDGSKLPLEENVANSQRVVEAAHAAGVGVEAELGVVGSGSRYASYGARGKGLTDVSVAEQFAAESGCDMLAVAVGSAHGQYNAEPRLDLDRLAEIRRRVEQPLSMHGGSGLSDEQFRAAIAGGICKINIGTDLRLAARDRMVEAVRRSDVSYRELTRAERRGFSQRAEHYLDLFAAPSRGEPESTHDADQELGQGPGD